MKHFAIVITLFVIVVTALAMNVPADAQATHVSGLSNCYYNGMVVSASAMHVTYMCYNGGALVEEGTWNVKRASGQ